MPTNVNQEVLNTNRTVRQITRAKRKATLRNRTRPLLPVPLRYGKNWYAKSK